MSIVERVLLVDDDVDLREAVCDLLVDAGVRSCLGVGSFGEVQARAADALACGLAIVDINLGEGRPTGTEVGRWLRTHGFTAPIVFLTGHAASDPRVITAAATPDTRTLTKPVSVRQLVSLIERDEPGASPPR